MIILTADLHLLLQLDVSRAFASDADFKYFEVENGPHVFVLVSAFRY